MKVMIIEDEPATMDRYASYISDYDSFFHVVAKATTFTQAEQLFEKTQPEIIFSDVVIPENSGLDFLEKKRNEGWNGLAVIISGYGQFTYTRQAIRISVFDYLLKPVFRRDIEQLLDKILVRARDKLPTCFKDGTRYPLHIKLAIEYVQINYNREVVLKDAARYTHVSPAYLSASFSKSCGMTFIDFVQSYRSDLAAELLRETDLTLEDIACRVGFGDSSYLNRCFRKKYLMPPGQYRRQYLGREDA